MSYPVDWGDRSHGVRARDDFRCMICGRSGVELHVHHVVPLSKGGSDDPLNLVSICRECHVALHDKKPESHEVESSTGFYCLNCDRFYSVEYGRVNGVCLVCGSLLRPWAGSRRG